MSKATKMIKPSRYLVTLKAVLIMLVLGLVSACDEMDKKTEVDAEGVLMRAESYLKQGQYRAASIEAKNALQQDPNNLDAHVILARIVLELGQAKAAISQLENIDGAANTDYVLTLSEAYIKRYKYFSAKELLENAKSTQQQQPFQYTLLLAQTHFGLGEVDKADQLFKKAISLAAEDSGKQTTAFVEYAKYLTATNKVTQAHEYLDKALAIGKHPEALVQKGILEYKNGNLEKAEDHLSNALIELKTTDIITPLRVQVLKGLIETLTQSGRSSEALIYSKLLAEAAPNAEKDKGKFNEAIKLYKEGKLEEAEEILTDIYSNGGNEFSGRMLGLINAMQGDLAEADSFLSEHVDPEVASSKAVRVLAETKLKLQQTEEALEILTEKVAQNPNDPEILSIYGLALLNSGKVELAKGIIEKTLSIAPEKVRLKVALANIHFNQGEKDKALSVLENAYQQNKSDEQVLTALVRLYMVSDNASKARALAQERLTASPNDAFSHNLAGAVEFAEKHFEKAVKHYEHASKLEPNNEATELALARSYIGAKQLDKAISLLDQLLQNAANTPTVIKTLIAAHELDNSVDSALTKLNKIADNNIQLWAPHTVLAEYYLRKNQIDKALEKIESAIQRNAVASYPVGIALTIYHRAASNAIKADDYDNARNHLMKGLQLKPNDIKLLSMLTSVEIRSGQEREAQKLLAQLEAAQPNGAIATELKGDLAYKSGDVSKALTLYQEAWAISPNNSLGNKIYRLKGKLDQKQSSFLNEWITQIPDSESALLVKAVELQKAGQQEKAVSYYEKALAINPQSLAAINNLAWLKFENKEEGALSLAEKGANLYPKNAAMLDTYGWILLNQGQKDKAKEILQAAYELAPDNEEIKRHYDAAK